MGDLQTRDFRGLAAGVFGKNWQWRLAVARGFNLRTVQNWAAGRPVPDAVRAELSHITDVIEQDQVSRTIAELVQNLRNLGLDDHVIAAQMHMKADALSPPELTPRDVVRKPKKAAE